MSGAAIFFLLLLLFLALYLGGGALLKYYFYGARGIEVIPNLEFWATLSSNLKDGWLFLWNRCRGRSRGGAYEEI